MNHLLQTNDITRSRGDLNSVLKKTKGNIHIVAVDTDYFFTADENKATYQKLKSTKQNVFYHEINSIHGHDAFLIEHKQLQTILNSIFNKQKQQNYVSN